MEIEAAYIQLDPNAVAAPAKTAAVITSEVVAIALATVAERSLEVSERRGTRANYKCDLEPLRSVDERRLQYRNWLLAKGLGELARGIKETLNSAFIYVELFDAQGFLGTRREWDDRFAGIEKRASQANFPQLLSRVSQSISETLSFAAEFDSLNRARNCLEHTNGIVSANQCNSADKLSLILQFPCPQTLYFRSGEWVVAPDGVIDTHEPGVDINAGFCLQIGVEQCEFGIGESITITDARFYDIVLACHFLAEDLASKLPVRTPAR